MSKRLNQIVIPILLAMALSMLGTSAGARSLNGSSLIRSNHAVSISTLKWKPAARPSGSGEPDLGNTSPPPRAGLGRANWGQSSWVEWLRTWVGMSWTIRFPR